MTNINYRKRAFYLLALMAGGAALAATALPLKLPTLCLFRLITGLPCCGCGMTHAFCALAKGQVHEAVNFNLASIPLALLVVVAIILLFAEALRNKPYVIPAWRKFQSFIIWSGAPILMLAWIVNLIRIFHP